MIVVVALAVAVLAVPAVDMVVIVVGDMGSFLELEFRVFLGGLGLRPSTRL